jgi:hypothetical protein
MYEDHSVPYDFELLGSFRFRQYKSAILLTHFSVSAAYHNRCFTQKLWVNSSLNEFEYFNSVNNVELI